MKASNRIHLSKQLVLALTILIGASSIAVAKQTKRNSFQPKYKVEKCDCMGFSDNIPTFLSDLSGATGIDIYGEGKSITDAQKSAQNMCIETYRNFASVSDDKEASKSVSQSGCHAYKSTQDGDWVSI